MADMDKWNPGNEDPYWMLEIRQGYDDAGAWLKNDRTVSVTRDTVKALRFPSRFEADCARSQLPMSESHRFEPTEHAWIAAPQESVADDDALIAELRRYSTGNDSTEFGRGWNCAMEEAEAIVRRLQAKAPETGEG